MNVGLAPKEVKGMSTLKFALLLHQSKEDHVNNWWWLSTTAHWTSHRKAKLRSSTFTFAWSAKKQGAVFGFSRKETPWEYQFWLFGIFWYGQTLDQIWCTKQKQKEEKGSWTYSIISECSSWRLSRIQQTRSQSLSLTKLHDLGQDTLVHLPEG